MGKPCGAGKKEGRKGNGKSGSSELGPIKKKKSCRDSSLLAYPVVFVVVFSVVFFSFFQKLFLAIGKNWVLKFPQGWQVLECGGGVRGFVGWMNCVRRKGWGMGGFIFSAR